MLKDKLEEARSCHQLTTVNCKRQEVSAGTSGVTTMGRTVVKQEGSKSGVTTMIRTFCDRKL